MSFTPRVGSAQDPPALARARVIVFDIDDTLFLERDYVASGFRAVGAWLFDEHHIDGFAERAWDLFEQGVRGVIFDRALEAVHAPTDPALVAELVKRYREHEPEISLTDDALRAMTALHSRYSLAAVSDGPLSSQSAKARALGLGRYLDPIVLTGAFAKGEGKPHPRAFREVEAALGATGEHCVYIADNPTKDFAGPRSLNWRTIRIRRPLGLHAGLPHPPEDVDAEIASLDELVPLLGSPPSA